MDTRDSETLLAKLVSFDTTSRFSNLELIRFVRDYLAQHGIEGRVIEDRGGAKASLFASIGGTDRPGFLLAGHTDVVPADGQAWTTDPFQLHRRDGRLYGRGSADMKGFLACVLSAVPRFLNQPLRTPIHLAFTCDEEVGCGGLRRLLEDSGKLPIHATMGIVGEPTSMRPVIGHKGKLAFRVEARGQACHSSNPSAGVNAIECAAELIAFIRRLNQQKQREGLLDPSYQVPHTTLQVGTVQGGTVLNTVPAECVFDFEIRYLPEDRPEHILDRIRSFATAEIEPAMKAVNTSCGFVFQEQSSYPGLSLAPDAEVIPFVQSLLDSSASPGKVAFGTEAGLYQQRCGIPMVVCGPGDIANAHQPDESIDAAQLAACDRFLDRLAEKLSCAPV
ncbi:MAG TPA: acetylornithine deacetylase [Bryobacteraceae bacterium]|nr:acetylornithine deacetylase [Bryobacteraceae bacterium]